MVRRMQEKMSTAESTACPVCNGAINPIAIRCRHCGSLLSDGGARGRSKAGVGLVLAAITVAVASITFFATTGLGVHSPVDASKQSLEK
jgi:hypothetical protein